MKSVEIMAPAGSFESLAAALRAGADSVYFGAGTLNMRSRSSANFSVDDLKKIVRLCRKAGVKSYLALNILVYDGELVEVRRLCDAAKAAGVDAVIAADPAVMVYAASIGMPVHVSVQANVGNIETVRFYAAYADVMVLARELTLPQIRSIILAIEKENITGPAGEKIRIELFAHGALCVSVSGKCYMSLGIYNSSGNRGACFQNCRRSYRVIDEDTGTELVVDNKYVMSPRDICTIGVLDRLIDAGAGIFKLEGRGRSPDYVHTVTRVYREAASCCLQGGYTQEKIEQWRGELAAVFNRGFWEGGYYLGEPLGEWTGSGGNLASVGKHHIARVVKFFNRLAVAELDLEAGGVSVGDELFVTGNTTGAVKFRVAEIRIDGRNVAEAAKGSVISVPVPEKVRPNDKVYILRQRRFGEDTPPVNG